MPAHGIMFHHFHDRVHPVGQGSISGEQLRAMIGFLGRERILPAKEWMRRAVEGELGEGELCLTFDDNLRCQFDVAGPVLREMGITAFWFVYTSVLEGQIEPLEVYRYFRTTQFASVEGFYEAFFAALGRGAYQEEVEEKLKGFKAEAYLAGFLFYTDADRRFRYVRDEILGPTRYFAAMDEMIAQAGLKPAEMARNLWMDGAALRQLHAEGHVIGLHSHTHPTRVERLDRAGQAKEYGANAACLKRLLGSESVAMSHPCNSYNQETLELLKGMGIKLGFRANMAWAEKAGVSELEYPREDHANVIKAMGL